MQKVEGSNPFSRFRKAGVAGLGPGSRYWISRQNPRVAGSGR
jgi:hypothetical protein